MSAACAAIKPEGEAVASGTVTALNASTARILTDGGREVTVTVPLPQDTYVYELNSLVALNTLGVGDTVHVMAKRKSADPSSGSFAMVYIADLAPARAGF